MSEIDMHSDLLKQLHELYLSKNSDYGNSVHETYKRYGLTSYLVRIEDKINRARVLSNSEAKVQDEKLEDTLMDMANYALLAVIELKKGSTNE